MHLPDVHFDNYSFSSPEHIADTDIASIWRVTLADGKFAALKVYKNNNWQDEAAGFDLLAAQNGHGSAQLFARAYAAVLMEWLDGPTLGDLTRSGDDEFATMELIDTANRLHQMPKKNIPSLEPLNNRFLPLFSATFTADCTPKTEMTIRRACDLAKELLAAQQDIRPLHGDLHHDNVKGSERGYLAFDAKGVLGERTFELANALRNPLGAEEFNNRPETIYRRSAVWSAGLNVSQNHFLSWAAAFSALSLSWSHESSFGPHNSKHVELIDTILSQMS